MNIIICPGIHKPELTQNFLETLQSNNSLNASNYCTQKVLVFPIQDYPAYSAVHILEFLQHYPISLQTPLVFISFSAGVVGAIGAAWGWQLLGGKVKALIAIDGWGVPLAGDFHIHRLSHDYFTHWSSALLGAGEDSFYAEPTIEHLDLWQKPDLCKGWWIYPAVGKVPERKIFTTAAEFIINLLQRYTISLSS
ncbi:MAG: hypothetical protein F6K16_25195 [Symploca sp. SIO2B6]|nr:hypothetical protein [Symploca sp. SIO2B6]